MKYILSVNLIISNLLTFFLHQLSTNLPLHSNQSLLTNTPSLVLHFDAVHYYHHSYSYQPSHAFLPTYPLLIQGMKWLTPHYALFLLLLLNRLCFTLTAYILYDTATLYNPMQTHYPLVVSLLFTYNPSIIFFHSLYTQSFSTLFFALATKYSLSHLQSNSKVEKCICIAAITAGGLFRTNSLFFSPIIGWTILTQAYTLRYHLSKLLHKIVEGIITLCCIASPFLYHQWTSNIRLGTSNAYGYVQEKHWGVGFMKYYKWSNAVFIAIGAPAIVWGCRIMVQKHKNIGLWLSFVLLLGVCVLYANVQSTTRFLCGHPFFYLQAPLLLQNRWFRIWVMSYYIIGTVMYTVGFPWT